MLLTLGIVYLAAAVATGSMAVALATAMLVLCVTVNVIGFVWLLDLSADARGAYGVDVNAISVVNLIAAVGLAVEFGVHIAAAFSRARGSRVERATQALVDMGASVFSGITVTKLVGVSVLSVAPSLLFRIYYFQIYLAIIVCGAFNGLFVMPVVLSLVGWEADARADDGGALRGDTGEGAGVALSKPSRGASFAAALGDDPAPHLQAAGGAAPPAAASPGISYLG